MTEAPGSSAAPRALLDACVLAPLMMREALLGFARAGLLTPFWSARIEEEWARAAAKEARGLPDAMIRGDIALAAAAFPAARAQGWEPLEAGLLLPDPNDRHVLAAAIVAGADVIVTDNIRDFPKRVLAEHGLTRAPADLFLTDRADADPAAAEAALRAAFADAPFGLEGAAAALKRGRLPRLAKRARGWFAGA